MPNDTLRAKARFMPKASGPITGERGFTDGLSYLPSRYAMPVIGDCLAPEVRSGALLIFDKTLAYQPGDFVNIFLRPATSGEQPGAVVKRLVMGPPPWVKAFPFEDHPDSVMLAIILAQELNPRRVIPFRCADILGIHKCLGVAPPEYKLVQIRLPAACSSEGRR